MIFLILLLPLLSFAQIEAEVGMYSNFIWRGTTFSENKPAVQTDLDYEFGDRFYVASFFSNAEFSDEAMNKNAKVTSEIDTTFGKRWNGENWEIQANYSRFFFPGAGVFDTDEWNLQGKYKHFLLELSYLDDYFGYHSDYRYVRLGYEWAYKEDLEGAFFVGFNSFNRPQGNIRTRETFETLDGAGNNDYFDLFFVNRKTFNNSTAAELGFNWTNRDEFTVEDAEVTKARAKDFAVIVSYLIPFSL